MGPLDIASFTLITIGGVLATAAGLLGARAEEGKDALDSEPGDDERAGDLIRGARQTLGRIASIVSRRRRVAYLISLALISFGVVAFVLARTSG